jgi:hypothetical protein
MSKPAPPKDKTGTGFRWGGRQCSPCVKNEKTPAKC